MNMTKLLQLVVTIALLVPVLSRADADIVRIPTEDRVVLNGVWFAPPGTTKSLFVLVPGLDGGVLFPGHDYGPLARELNTRGYALLIPNMRSAALNFAFSTFETANEDLRGVVAFAKTRGITDIALFGTSLGGPRVAWYLSKNEEPGIRTVGFIASLASPYQAEGWSRPDGRPNTHFVETLEQSRALVLAGKPNELVRYNFTLGRTLPMSAQSFLSYWGDPNRESNASTVKFIATSVKVPTLVIHGSADQVAVPRNAEEIYKALQSAPKKDLVIVEGASHYLSPGWIADAYAKQIVGWLSANMPAK